MLTLLSNCSEQELGCACEAIRHRALEGAAAAVGKALCGRGRVSRAALLLQSPLPDACLRPIRGAWLPRLRLSRRVLSGGKGEGHKDMHIHFLLPL